MTTSITLSVLSGGAILFCLLFLITIIDPRVGIVGAVVWPYLQYLLTRDLNLLPEYFTLIDEMFLTCLFLAFVLKVFVRSIRFKVTIFDIILTTFVLFGILSFVVNKSPLLNAIMSFRYYFQYVILYYVISYFDFKTSFKYFIVLLMLALSLIQVPLQIYQYFTWTPSLLVTNHADAAYGTLSFGSANILGMLMLTFAFLTAKVQLDISNRVKYIIIITLFLGMVLAHSKVSYIFLFLLILFQYKTKLFNLNSIRILIVSTVLSAFLIYFATFISDDVKYILSFEGISQLFVNQITDKDGGGRIMYFLLTLVLLEQYSFSPFVGLGPGTYASYAGITLNAPYVTNILGVSLEKRGTRFDSEITGMIGEYGYIGIIVFTMLIFSLYARASIVVKSGATPFDRSFAGWFQFFVFIFFFGGFINGLWQAQFFAVNFWVSAGIINSAYNISREQCPSYS